MTNQIPAFDSPPINEVAFGLQFHHPIKDFNVKFVLDYWEKIRNRYPLIDDHPPLPHQIDSPVKPQKAEGMAVQVRSKMPARYWLIDPFETELIQVQADKFMRNWRQISGDEVYPRFGQLFESFWQEWVTFRAFAKEKGIADIRLDQCELIYVNHIEPGEKWEGFSGLADMFSVLRPRDKQAFLPAPELFNWQSRYVFPDSTGRLTVEVAPNFRGRDLKLIISFSLTGRGMPKDASDDNVRAWFELAHEWIVRGFDELTTPTMHQIWRKKS